MIKSVLAASAMLVALCSAATAHEAMHYPSMASAATTQVSEIHPNALGFAAPTQEAGYEAHQYHGGPKADD
ncbi:hypothetical protein AB7M17_004509 [Bradyrhizobium sp. USDA 377]